MATHLPAPLDPAVIAFYRRGALLFGAVELLMQRGWTVPAATNHVQRNVFQPEISQLVERLAAPVMEIELT